MATVTNITAPRAEMQAIAEEAKAQRREVRIFEQERPHRGRILRVMHGAILIMR